MEIYCSTGGLKAHSFQDAVKLFLEVGIDRLELSAGKYVSESIKEKILMLSQKTKIMLHNYFPPVNFPFVLNLASMDSEISRNSIEFFKNSIDLSSHVGAKYYGIHSGFLVDPDVSQLGSFISDKKISDREIAMELFIQRTTILASYAASKNIRLLVENNVLSTQNYVENKMDIMLLSSPAEIDFYFREMQGKVGLLLDVGHLKVSCKTFEFDLVESFKQINCWTEGYHLSENSGLKDDHRIFDSSAWFISLLDSNVEFSTLEINNSEPRDIAQLAAALEVELSK